MLNSSRTRGVKHRCKTRQPKSETVNHEPRTTTHSSQLYPAFPHQVLNSSRTRGVKHRCETLSIGGRALVLRYPLHPPGAEGQGSLEYW